MDNIDEGYEDPRDPRSTQILTAPLRIQAWFVLGEYAWPELALIGAEYVQTTVVVDREGLPRNALLLEFNAEAQNLDESWLSDQERLRRMGALLRLAWFGLPKMVAARLVDTVVTDEKRLMCSVCHPFAVGASRKLSRTPADGHGLLSNSILQKELAPSLWSSLHWYLSGLDAEDPLAEAQCLWAAVESLAPEIRRVPRCGKCQEDLAPCVSCGSSVERPAVLAGIRELVLSKGVCTKKEINELYDWRSALFHGGRSRDFDLLCEAVEHVGEVRRLVESLISSELGLDHFPNTRTHPDFESPLKYQAKLSFDPMDGVLDTPYPMFGDVEVGVE